MKKKKLIKKFKLKLEQYWTQCETAMSKQQDRIKYLEKREASLEQEVKAQDHEIKSLMDAILLRDELLAAMNVKSIKYNPEVKEDFHKGGVVKGNVQAGVGELSTYQAYENIIADLKEENKKLKSEIDSVKKIAGSKNMLILGMKIETQEAKKTLNFYKEKNEALEVELALKNDIIDQYRNEMALCKCRPNKPHIEEDFPKDGITKFDEMHKYK